jgi:DNA-binding transcriptional MerR regulator
VAARGAVHQMVGGTAGATVVAVGVAGWDKGWVNGWTAAGYRVYAADAVPVVSFILKARRAGFTVAEIRDIVRLRRSGQAPCDHVRALIDAKLMNLERALADLKMARDELTAIRKTWRKRPGASAAVCPNIERMK